MTYMPLKGIMAKNIERNPQSGEREVNRIIRDSIAFSDIKLIHREMF